MGKPGIFNRISQWFRRFMTGRYGTDKLNNVILIAAVALCVISLLIPVAQVKLALMLVYYALITWALFRMFSRNTYKRYQENRKYLQLLDRIRDREHRYYDCPRCHQQVRVPRGKGKISITCPKCREKFIKKT